MTTPNRKIAVFTTSDIQRCWSDDERRHVSTAGDGTKLYTTGALETAIAEGYEIYVMSTRSKFGTHDAWWRDLVPAENVIAGFYDGGGANDEGSISAWRGLYTRLGFDPSTLRLERDLTVFTAYNMERYGKYRWDETERGYNRETWMSYYDSLHQVGAEAGRDFSDDNRRLDIEIARRLRARAHAEQIAD